MAFVVPPLGYAPDALEPYIDATTMTIHHDKHHSTYVNNLNTALAKFPELNGLGLVDLNQAVGTGKVPAEVETAVRCAASPTGTQCETIFTQSLGCTESC